MIRFFFVAACCLFFNNLSAQNDCDDCDTTFRKPPPFVKEDYKRFRKDSCNLEKYTDSKEAQELFCRARYYFSINNFINSIELSKQAYMKGTSGKLKFRILKLTAQNYRAIGDTKGAAVYDEKVKRALQNNPDIDKEFHQK